MKKEVQVKVPARKAVKAVPATTKKVEKVYCDICTKEVNLSMDNRYGSGGHNCQLCGRDVCRNRKTNGQPTCYREDDDWTDGPYDKYCIYCWELKFEKYKSRFQNIEDSRDLLVERLEKQIKKESLAKEAHG